MVNPFKDVNFNLTDYETALSYNLLVYKWLDFWKLRPLLRNGAKHTVVKKTEPWSI